MKLVEEIKSIKSTERDIKNFALVVGGVIALYAIASLFFWGASCPSCFLVSGVIIGMGAVVPSLLKPLQKVWMALAVVLGWVMSHIILIMLFYVVVTPIALLARLFGKKFLDMRVYTDARTYWVYRRNVSLEERIEYERQF